jgi:hypothetical protein
MEPFRTRYNRERRAYPGGRPLIRTMSPSSRQQLSYRLVPASARVRAATVPGRYARIADGVGTVRGGRRPRPYDVRNLLSGKSGGSPERIFEIGEALWEADVSWINGLVTLRWVPEYVGSVIGVIGQCINDANLADLKTMWSTFALLTAPDYSKMENSAYETYQASRRGGPILYDEFPGLTVCDRLGASWAAAEHQALRAAWRAWNAAREDASMMLPEVQSYLALRRLPASVPQPNWDRLERVAIQDLHDRIVLLSPDSNDPETVGFWLERGS